MATEPAPMTPALGPGDQIAILMENDRAYLEVERLCAAASGHRKDDERTGPGERTPCRTGSRAGHSPPSPATNPASTSSPSGGPSPSPSPGSGSTAATSAATTSAGRASA